MTVKVSLPLKFIFSLLILFSLLLTAKQVSAGCSGTINCVHQVQKLVCTDGVTPCSIAGGLCYNSSGASGICSSVSTTSSYSVSCSSKTDSNSCSSANCNSGDSRTTGSCSWTNNQICTPNQWDGACGAHGCGSQDSAQCNSSGTGWDCHWDPSRCNSNPPPPAATATPTQQKCVIQGLAVPGQAPFTNQTVTCNGLGSQNFALQTSGAYAYFFTNVTPGDYTCSVTAPPGYSVGYTYCANSITCHNTTPTPMPPGGAVITCPSQPVNGLLFADLYWHFTAETNVTPTPTVNPACACANNACTSQCLFNKYNDVSYNSSILCSREVSILGPTPGATDKTSFCQRFLRTLGDVDGNGVVDNFDYLYYVAAVNGGGIPTFVNPDVNGDGLTSPSDRSIIVRTIPQANITVTRAAP